MQKTQIEKLQNWNIYMGGQPEDNRKPFHEVEDFGVGENAKNP